MYKAMVLNIFLLLPLCFSHLVIQILKLVMINDFDESIGLSMSVMYSKWYKEKSKDFRCWMFFIFFSLIKRKTVT
jgi:hypothetical protein